MSLLPAEFRVKFCQYEASVSDLKGRRGVEAVLPQQHEKRNPWAAAGEFAESP